MKMTVLHRSAAALVALQVLVPPWGFYTREPPFSDSIAGGHTEGYLPIWSQFEGWQAASVNVSQLTIQLVVTFVLYLLAYRYLTKREPAEQKRVAVE